MKLLSRITRPLLAATAAGWCALVALASPSQEPPDSGLAQLSQRLRVGDLAAIDELLARTRPATIDLGEANARAAELRADIERLRQARAARPRTPPRKESEPAPAPPAASTSIDPLREARAWLRAGDPERCLNVLPSGDGEAAYLRARALAKTGRDDEALEAFRQLAESAASSTLRLRAASEVAHMEWRARTLRARGSQP